MKIAVVTRNLRSGGAERVISQLLDKWVDWGNDCHLILLDKTEHFYKINDSVNLHEIGRLSENSAKNKLKVYAKVRQIIKEIKPDIVLSMPEEIGIYVIGAMLGTGIPVVVSERNNPRVMPYVKATRALRKILYPFAAGYIFQTQQAASFFSKRIQNKGIVLPNPLDLSRIPEPYTGERSRTVVGAGRFEKQKNFPLLIDAFAKFYENHRDYKLVIYGDGKLRESITSYAENRLPRDVFEFPGRETALPEKIKSCGMFVLSSDFEGMPNVLIEAMSMGVPVISTDCPSGGPADLIRDGENGYLVPTGDADAISEKMKQIADGESCFASLTASADKIKKELDASAVCQKWLDYLKHCGKKG